MKRHTYSILMWIMCLYAVMGDAPAYGYIDPGSGSYFVQLVLGCVLGSLLTVKLWWEKFWRGFCNVCKRVARFFSRS